MILDLGMYLMQPSCYKIVLEICRSIVPSLCLLLFFLMSVVSCDLCSLA